MTKYATEARRKMAEYILGLVKENLDEGADIDAETCQVCDDAEVYWDASDAPAKSLSLDDLFIENEPVDVECGGWTATVKVTLTNLSPAREDVLCMQFSVDQEGMIATRSNGSDDEPDDLRD